MSLLSVPLEFVLQWFTFKEISDVPKLSRVNKKLNDLIFDYLHNYVFEFPWNFVMTKEETRAQSWFRAVYWYSRGFIKYPVDKMVPVGTLFIYEMRHNHQMLKGGDGKVFFCVSKPHKCPNTTHPRRWEQ